MCDQPELRVGRAFADSDDDVKDLRGCDTTCLGEVAAGVGAAWLFVVEAVRIVRLVGDAVGADGSIDVRVERLVGDSVGADSKSLGWLRVATIVLLLPSLCDNQVVDSS